MSMEVNNKVAADLLRKYGVLVDPLSLSEQALARLARRINYPRVPLKPPCASGLIRS